MRISTFIHCQMGCFKASFLYLTFGQPVSWVIIHWLDTLQYGDHPSIETEHTFQPWWNVTCFPVYHNREPFKWQMIKLWGIRDWCHPELLDFLVCACCFGWNMAILLLTFHWLMAPFDVSICAGPLLHIIRFYLPSLHCFILQCENWCKYIM